MGDDGQKRVEARQQAGLDQMWAELRQHRARIKQLVDAAVVLKEYDDDVTTRLIGMMACACLAELNAREVGGQ